MTETECYDCGYNENCDWGVIMKNIMTKISPRCVTKVWYETSKRVFWEKTDQISARVVSEGE